jgi:hypothetical protein
LCAYRLLCCLNGLLCSLLALLELTAQGRRHWVSRYQPGCRQPELLISPLAHGVSILILEVVCILLRQHKLCGSRHLDKPSVDLQQPTGQDCTRGVRLLWRQKSL